MSDLVFNRRTGFDVQQSTAGQKGNDDVNFHVMLHILSGDSNVLLENPKNTPPAAEGQSLSHSSVETGLIADPIEDANDRSTVKTERGEAIANPHEHGSTDHIQVVQDFILESLAFTAMKDREEDVVEAHGETLDWLFSGSDSKPGSAAKPAANFPTWLRGDQSIFWVNGKAGSGKSTLMRFIFNHKKTFEELRKWAGKKSLVTAGYYFWTSGSVEQRSQAGLLRYLLFQLLQKHRHLTPITFPRKWEQYVNSSTKDRIKAKIVWELPELTEGLRLFLQNALRSLKICIFVDGLDEFDGDHNEIIQFFRSIPAISKGNLKLCLSSRPWPVFQMAFQDLPTLRLQDLTYQDMVQYVADKFSGDEGLRKMLQDEVLDGKALVTELVTRADGVFLWVTLVVRSLTKSFCEGDCVVDLRRRLLLLPTCLDDLFQYTLFDVQPSSSLREASSILQLIRAREAVCEFTGEITSTSLTLWELALAREPYIEPIADTELHREKNEDALKRCQDTEAIIDGCCAGLLGIKDNLRQHLREVGIEGHSLSINEIRLVRSKVTYIHRTVRDFLMYTDAWDALLQYNNKEHFDPHICHIVSSVLQLKLPLHEPTRHRNLDEWWPGIVLSMTHARLSHPHSAARLNHLINQINSTLNQYWLSRRGDTWARSTFGSYEKRNRAVIDNPFLSLATKFELTDYVQSELDTTDETALSGTGGKPLLSYALEFLINRQLTVYPLADPSLVGVILSYGGDPNKVYKDFAQKEETPWLYALKAVRDGNRRGWIEYYDVEEQGVVRWVGIMKMLLKAGADPNAMIVETKWDPEATALEVVETVCEKFKSREMQGMRDLMLEKGAKRRQQVERHSSDSSYLTS